MKEEESCLGQDLILTAESDNELGELRDFVFDTNQNIDVDALESYLQQNAQIIQEQDDLIDVDLSKMVAEKPATKSKEQEEVKATEAVPTASIGIPQAISEVSESTFLKEL